MPHKKLAEMPFECAGLNLEGPSYARVGPSIGGIFGPGPWQLYYRSPSKPLPEAWRVSAVYCKSGNVRRAAILPMISS